MSHVNVVLQKQVLFLLTAFFVSLVWALLAMQSLYQVLIV